MISSGFIGERVGYKLLCRLGRHIVAEEQGPDRRYHGQSKLETLFGADIWENIVDKTIIDFGCGNGYEAIEMAKHGARRVTGFDYQQSLLDQAEENAMAAGVADICKFSTKSATRADMVFSLDGFEHYDDPALVLQHMKTLLNPGGRVFISFGPPWLHPYGGHLFSVFPWAHLIFTEKALIRWRSDFKSDGANRFREVAGGLNQMTVGLFNRLVNDSGFQIERFEPVPIKKLRWFSNPLTREFFTSVVRCTLRQRVPDAVVQHGHQLTHINEKPYER